MGSWLVVAGERQANALQDYLVRSGIPQQVRIEQDCWRARAVLAGELAGANVVVGEGAVGPAAVNVAAAFAADGHAGEVVLAVHQASGSLRSRANRAGITRVLTSDELVDRPASASGDARGERREGVPVVCFVSGRGGVGKSTVCALAGHIAASWGMDVAAVDLDLAFGNLYALCGLDRPCDLTPGGEAADPELIVSCGRQAAERLHVWGPCASPEFAELVQPRAEQLVAQLTQTHDLVLVDTTSSWSDAVACAAQMADRLVIVSDDRPGALSALARCGALAVRLGVARTRIVRLMNGCDARGRDETFVTQAAQGLECARELRVLDGGAEAAELLASGHAAELARLANPLSTSLATGLAQLLRELGHLPTCEAAARALEGPRHPRHFLDKLREAI